MYVCCLMNTHEKKSQIQCVWVIDFRNTQLAIQSLCCALHIKMKALSVNGSE